ncbi:DUF6575 domain-containing protein [Amycolatopsis sp. NPDC004079]|uniref:DUF6575 domain-containing protein n=1 Tax=Amycolatopsis sp. NPDC004079 TaxID=3154549 RepID=UPI0033AE19E8
MTWLPEGTPLGDLRIVETFAFYDGPRIFSAISGTGQFYVAVWVDSSDESDTWIYVPVSEGRLIMVRSGGMSLRDAMQHSEGVVYEVELAAVPGDGIVDKVSPIYAGGLPEEWLPDSDFSVKLPTPTLPPMSDANQLELAATQEHRTHVRIRVMLPEFTRTEAPVQTVGKILVATQNVYDNLGYRLQSDEPPTRGKVPSEISSQMAASVTQLSAASFVVELASGQLDDIFGDSLFAQATRQLMSILSQDFAAPELTQSVRELKVRAAKSFRSFVEKLAESNADVAIAAAGSGFPHQLATLSSDRIQDLLSRLRNLVPKEEVEIIRGRMRLFSIDEHRRRFGLRDVSDSDPVDYEGRIDERAEYAATHATINSIYEVAIEATTILDESVGEEKVTYRLVQLFARDE